MNKFAKFLAPLATLWVSIGSGGVPTLETADITALASAVGGQMGGFITNMLLVVGVGLILTFGFLIVRKLTGITRRKK